MRQARIPLGFLLVASLGFVSGMGLSHRISFADGQTKQVIPKELTSYRDVVKQVLPAVVSIKVVTQTHQVQGRVDMDEEWLDQLPRRGQPRGQQPGPFGSGAIVDPKGIIVTNNHVVASAREVEVTLTNGQKFKSKSIFTDPKTDLAVVKIDPKGTLPWIDFGNSDEIEIGDRVLAVGAPFGLTGSVTHGIISAKGRSSLGMNMYEDFLQTDAPINPGNSGGPLVSLDGKIIGINSAIKSQNGTFMGIGLAIPSRVAKEIVEQLSAKGSVLRGYLGVRVGELTPEVAAQLKLEMQRGVVIGEVTPDSPAANAGLQEGDIVLSINSKPLTTGKDLQTIVMRAPIGKALPFEILREGKKQTVQVKIEAQPEAYGLEDRAVRSTPRRQMPRDTISLERLGLQVTDLSSALAEQLGYAKTTKGALLVRVEPGSLADSVGLRQGMLIVQADKQSVPSATALKEVVDQASLQEGLLLLVRTPQGGSQYVVIQVK